MSVCTFKRLPFICFFFLPLSETPTTVVQIVSTPIHNSCHAPRPMPPSQDGQENKPSKIAIFDFTSVFIFFWVQGFHLLLVVAAVAAVRLMLVWIRPNKTKIRQYSPYTLKYIFCILQYTILLVVAAVAAVRLMLVWIRPNKTKIRQDSPYTLIYIYCIQKYSGSQNII